MAGKKTFYLHVVAAEKMFYNDRAVSLTINTLDGSICFLAHHLEMIVALEPGELTIEKEDGSRITVLAGFGSIVFANNRATVLVETCETQEELDARRAQEAADRARERLRQKQSMVEYRTTQAALARALSRLKFKDKQLH